MSHIKQAIICFVIFSITLSVAAQTIALQRVATGFDAPLYVIAPGSDNTRLFVLEKNTGNIKTLNLNTGVTNAEIFLSVENINTDGERGLLGLAFHPQYASTEDDAFFVNLTNSDGDTEIRKYRLSSNPNRAKTSSELVMRFTQPYSNHNGGWIGFGPDGYLYIASGDGGDGNDPDNNSQSRETLLGKMLRIDIDADDFPADTTRNYAIPANNPFFGDGAPIREEIWAYGLRNPWRASFDRSTGDLLIADVGQLTREEINFQPASSGGGENYGWRLREGSVATPGVGGSKPADNVDPIYDYPHGSGQFEGNSVTGGYVYRGPLAAVQGKYFFSDFSNSRIWSVNAGFETVSALTDWTNQLIPNQGSVNNVASFGEDALGNLYIVDFDGDIFKVVAANVPPPPKPDDVTIIAPAIFILLSE